VPPASDLGRSWEVKIAAIPSALDNDPAARMTAVLVVSDGLVLGVNVESHPPSEPDEIAALLEREIMAAAGNAGCMPDRVSVRHVSLVEPLARALTTRGIVVEHAEKLPGIDDALQSLLAHLGGGITPLHLLHSSTSMNWMTNRMSRCSCSSQQVQTARRSNQSRCDPPPRGNGHSSRTDAPVGDDAECDVREHFAARRDSAGTPGEMIQTNAEAGQLSANLGSTPPGIPKCGTIAGSSRVGGMTKFSETRE
jgi:hypothetical protein